MKVVYFNRSAPSYVHIHAGSYASCFYIPDKKVILFTEQHGSFGGSTCSITRRTNVLKEAQAVAEGRDPDVDGVDFSDVQIFDYDSTKLAELISNAKQGKDLEGKVQSGVNDLFAIAKPKSPADDAINPATLDAATKKRLEALVDKYVENNAYKSGLLGALDSQKAAQLEAESTKQMLMRELEEYKTGRVHFGRGAIGHTIQQARKAGLEDIAKEFARFCFSYNRRYPKSHNLEEQLLAAEILGKPAKEILAMRERGLVEVMSANYMSVHEEQYIKIVRHQSEGIPESSVRRAAQLAYGTLIKSYHSRASDGLLRAIWLAKKFLSKKELHHAAEIFITGQLNSKIPAPPGAPPGYGRGLPGNAYDLYGRALMELDLPKNTIRPFMFKVLEATLHNSEDAKKIIQKYKFTDNEIRRPVNELYVQSVNSGNFGLAMKLRNSYGQLIRDQSIPTEDLRLLAGVANYRPAEKQSPEEE